MCLSIFYIVRTFFKYDLDYTSLLSFKKISLIVVFVLAYSGMVFIMSYAWTRILRFLANQSISYNDCYPIYVKSSLGKYIPGNFMHYATRNIIGNNLKLSQLDIGLSSVIEIFAICATASIWSFILVGNTFFSIILTYTNNMPSWVILLVVLVVITFVTFVILLIRHNKASVLVKRCHSLLNPKFLKLLLGNITIQSITFLIPGFILVQILSWNSPIMLGQFRLVISAFIVSWVIGFIVPGAPGGIGVREAVLAFMLKDICGEENILIAVVIQRLISVLGDVFAYIISLLLSVIKRNNTKIQQ